MGGFFCPCFVKKTFTLTSTVCKWLLKNSFIFRRKRERLIQRMRQFSSSGLLGGGSSSNSGATTSETQSTASSTVFAEAGTAGCIGGGGVGCSGAVAGSTNVGVASMSGARARLRSKEGSMDSTDSGVSSLRYHILLYFYIKRSFFE